MEQSQDEPRLPLIKRSPEKGFFLLAEDRARDCFFASCASEPSAEHVCLWLLPLKANSGDTSMASEQDTSLVSRSILNKSRKGSFLVRFCILKFEIFTSFLSKRGRKTEIYKKLYKIVLVQSR